MANAQGEPIGIRTTVKVQKLLKGITGWEIQ
jgi:hypothetical protein